MEGLEYTPFPGLDRVKASVTVQLLLIMYLQMNKFGFDAPRLV